MKKQQFYKKAPLWFIFLWPVVLLGQVTPSGYMPYHEYLQKLSSNYQQEGYGSRYLVYKEIAFTHDTLIPANPPSPANWTYADSGNYYYDTANLLETNGNDFFYTNGDSDNWINHTQFSNGYDSYNELLADTGQLWNGTGWVDSFNYGYSYNNGLITSQVYSLWNSGSGSFVYVYNYNYTYNAGNLPATTVYQSWTGSTWQNDTQYIYTYSSQPQLVETITQLWNSGTNTWENALKQDYTYDAVGNNNLTFGYSWNGTGWDNYSVATRAYNQVNVVSSYVLELWNADSGTYINSYQELYDFDYDYNNTSFENYNWNSSTALWVPIRYYYYTYDQYNNDTYELDEYYNGSGFTPTDQYFYYYDTFEAPAGILALENNLDAQVFPNPGSGNTLNLKVNTDNGGPMRLDVYDALGHKIFSQNKSAIPGSNTFQLYLPAICAGTYYLRVIDIDNAESSTLKFVRD